MLNSIFEYIFEYANSCGDRAALVDSESVVTYAELKKRIISGAESYKDEEIINNCVIVYNTQNLDFVVKILSLNYAGLIPIPVEKKAKPEYIEHIISEINKTEKINSETLPNIAEILFTTGTTGNPKGIIISKKANVAIAENIARAVEMTENSVEIIPLPLSHSHGLRTVYAHLFTGSTSVIINGVMNINLFFEMCRNNRVNAFDLTPTVAKLLLKIAKKGLKEIADNIDYIELGTSTLEESTKEGLIEIFTKARIYNFYGSTEAGRTCSLDFTRFNEKYCIGKPSVNAKFYIVDDDKNIITEPMQSGCVAVSGSMMMDGYIFDDESSKDALKDGILYSSDLGYFDSEGNYYVIGRKDDVINYKGIKIDPADIETVANSYDEIEDSACVPYPDKLCGQVPKLFVKVKDKDNFDKKIFTAYLKDNLDAEKIPQYVETIDEIPRSSNGKLLRKALREKK